MKIASPPRSPVFVEQDGNELVFRRRTRPLAVDGFFLIWLTIGGAACVSLFVMLCREPTIDNAVVCILFLIIWLTVSAYLTRVILGFERLNVGPAGLEHRTRAGRRLVPLAEVQGVFHTRKVIKGEDVADRIEHGLRIETVGQPIRFGRGLDERDVRWMVDRLLIHIRALAPGQPIAQHRVEAAMSGDRFEILRPDRPVTGPPSDSTIRLQAPDRDGAQFIRRDAVSPFELASGTVLTLIWNAGVGLYAANLIKNFTWFDLPLVLILGAIGLLLLAGWIIMMLTPFMDRRWVICPHGASNRCYCLGLRWTRRFDAAEIIRVEIRWGSPGPGGEEDRPCTLSLVGDEGRDLMALRNLTEGEARWIGGVACDMLRHSLPEGRGWAPSPWDGDTSLWDHEIDG